MIAQYITPVFIKVGSFGNNNGIIIDVSGYTYVVAQFVTPSGIIDIASTNDSGDITGFSDGSAKTATNFTSVQAIKLSDGTAVTTIVDAGLYKINVAGRYLRFYGINAAATKVVIMLANIQ